MRALAVLNVVFAVLGVAYASSSSLLTQPGFIEPSLYFRSSNKSDRALKGPVGVPASDPPTYWSIAQWNIPHDFPVNKSADTSACVGGSALWGVATPSGRVCVHGGGSDASGYTVELAQDGAEVECGKEMDLFTFPVGRNDRHYPQNFWNVSAPLSSMSALTVTWTAQLVHLAVTPRCGKPPYCAARSGEVDYGYSTLGVIFSNAVASPPQTMFYQVNFHDSRGPVCKVLNTCNPHRNWYFTSDPFGATDHIGSYGASCLAAGQPAQHYNLDLLPKVTDVFRNPPAGVSIDTNVSNWRASGLYLGSGLQGSVVQTMLISDLSLVQTTM